MVLIELQWRVFAKSLTPSSAAPERSAGYQQRSCWRQLQRNVRPVANAVMVDSLHTELGVAPTWQSAYVRGPMCLPRAVLPLA